MREYDLSADWYASERSGPISVPETVALASSLPTGSLILVHADSGSNTYYLARKSN